MKNIVLYKSKYGNTLSYAKWIAEALDYEIRDFSKFHKNEVKNYQHIIFGSGVYMGKMNHIKKVLQIFKDKPIMIFACAGNNNDKEEIDVIKKSNFTDHELSFHRFFYLPGGVDFTKVKGIKKIMLNVFKNILEKKQNKTNDEIAILDAFTNPTYYVDKKHINDIVNYAKNLKLSQN